MILWPDVSPLTLLAALFLAVVAMGRVTRLVVHDAWPPVRWIRERFVGWSEQTRTVGDHQELTWRASWTLLATCPFCFAPWAVLVSLVWAWASQLDASSWAGGLWWLAHIWLAVSYLSAMLVLRDEPPEEG